MMCTIPDPTDRGAHAQTWVLLPWLANGTLSGAELKRVQAHLDRCPACRAQLEWERGLRTDAQQAPPLSAQQAFARLQPRLGAQQGRGWRRWAMFTAANDARWLRAVAAVQFGAIVGLGLVLARSDGDAARYHTLGAQASAHGNLVVSFAPATPERELRRILQASSARIVDGPVASGAWVLAVAPADASPALRRLRAEPAVTLAEPLAMDVRP